MSYCVFFPSPFWFRAHVLSKERKNPEWKKEWRIKNESTFKHTCNLSLNSHDFPHESRTQKPEINYKSRLLAIFVCKTSIGCKDRNTLIVSLNRCLQTLTTKPKKYIYNDYYSPYFDQVLFSLHVSIQKFEFWNCFRIFVLLLNFLLPNELSENLRLFFLVYRNVSAFFVCNIFL